MHVIATNLSIWIATIFQEAAHALEHHEEIDHYATSMQVCV